MLAERVLACYFIHMICKNCTSYKALQESRQKKMLCVAVWCGFKQAKTNSLSLFSKLGGNFLGYLHVDSKLPTFEKLLDLQLQASKLMRHPTRFARDVLFWQDTNILTDRKFVCLDSMDEHQSKHAEEILERANQSKLLSTMYNEDDSWAERMCANTDFIQPYSKSTKRDEVYIEVDTFNVHLLGRRLLHFENKGVTRWVFHTLTIMMHDLVKHLGFLRHAHRCVYVRIHARTIHTTNPKYVGITKATFETGSIARYEGERLAKFVASLK